MLEPLLLFESVMIEDRPVLELIDSDYTYRSEELHHWYRAEIPFKSKGERNRFLPSYQQFNRIELNDKREGGVITTAAILTMTSSPLRTNPITRGAWVAGVIFNRPPPPPPDIRLHETPQTVSLGHTHAVHAFTSCAGTYHAALSPAAREGARPEQVTESGTSDPGGSGR